VRIIRRLLKWALYAFVAIVAVGGVLFILGLRVVLDGGGTPRLQFIESADAQAQKVEQHREAQRAQAPPAPTPPAPPAPQEDKPAALPTLPDVPVPPTASGAAPVAAYWTDFRGPNRDGHYRERPIRTDWPSGGLKPVWKQPIGAGYASFVIAKGRAFTIEQRGGEEVVAAYEVATGREVWTNRWKARFQESMGGDGPRATPTWADGRVYALGATGELRALDDATGKTVWRINILEDTGAANLQWGMSASPLVVGDTLVVLPGGRNGTSVAAYNRNTGKRVWAALDDQQSYSSPMLMTLAGVPQIVVFSASRLMGITPDRGTLLWEHPWKTQFDIHAAQPLALGGDRLFLSSGYRTGAAVIEVAKSGDRFAVKEIWRNSRMKNQFTSSLLHEGFIYGLDESILACVDAATGDLKWKGGRYGYGQTLLASGHIIVLTEDGDLALVRAVPTKHEEIARFPVLEGKTWNHPAMSDGFLLVRNIAEMAAFDLRK
jgi:outer membrane protein assembly factor BamB